MRRRADKPLDSCETSLAAQAIGEVRAYTRSTQIAPPADVTDEKGKIGTLLIL